MPKQLSSSKIRKSFASVLIPIRTFLIAVILLINAVTTASIDQINPQGWGKIISPVGEGHMHYPRALSFEVDIGGTIQKKILLNWQTNNDNASIFPYKHGWAGSTNAGVTWGSPAPVNTPNIDLMGCIKRTTDGVIVAIPFFPNNSLGTGPTSFTFSYQTSADNGVSWTTYTNGLVDFSPTRILGFRFHRGILQQNDGTLFAAAYGTYYGGLSTRAMLMQSTDGGATWTQRSSISGGLSSSDGVTEATVVRCKNGDFLAVMRTQIAGSMVYKRSTDQGLSWGVSATLPGVPVNVGVDPYLWLMPNGILVLNYGNNVPGNMRHCLLAFSADGNGTNWGNVTQTYTSQTTGLGNKSSGYDSVIPITAHCFLEFSDRALWNYYGSDPTPTPNPFGIWKETVDIVLGLKNRIDLKGKYAAVGASMITTDLTDSNGTFPEARITGAFDGSTEYWSSAFKNGTSGTYTIDLKTTNYINAVGVCLQYNSAQSSTIEVSTNNTTWTTVKTYSSVTHNALDYTSFTSIPTRYVRVTTSGAGPRVCLNEIEVYTTADTFENYALADVPFGYSAPSAGCWVTEGVTPLPSGHESVRALYLNDSSSANITISKNGYPPTTTKTLEFWLRPKGYTSSGSIQWRLLSGSVNAFRVAVFSDGSIKYYNGSAYVNTTGTGSPAGAGTAPLDSWSRIRVDASASTGTGTLYVNGVLKGTIGKETTVTSMNGFLFGSSGGTPVGDKALFDDVDLR